MNVLLIIQIVIYSFGTLFLLYISKKSILNFKVHGFYRFFVFNSTLLLVLLNAPFWFINPFSLLQIISWVLLIISTILVFQSFYLLKKHGGIRIRENETTNFKFENTNILVNDGIYKYIRHPMYSSLLFLCLGAFSKSISLYTTLLTVIAILFLILTAKTEEKENIKFFGYSYEEYIKETKMFVPFVL
jgi:protein-S-isoprenylcysteine O-methyltransferase Ste14